MKSKIKKNACIPEYPKLKICITTERVVLFTSPETGVLVARLNSNKDVGKLSSNWNEGEFTTFNDEVVLSN